MEFNRVRVTVNGCRETSQNTIDGFASWAGLSVPGKKPGAMSLRVEYEEQAGIVPFAIFESRPHTMERGFHLQVPVTWNQDGPFTRRRGKDNVDIILLNPKTRHYADIQASVVVRKGKFLLAAQRLWEGDLAGSSMEELQFIPSSSEFAYPGSDYQSTWRGMADVLKFVWTILDKDTKQPLVPTAAQWNPPPASQMQGWMSGVVTYFNMVTGTGQILGDDGVLYFVHFSTIESLEPMRVLVPMSRVYFLSAPPSGKGLAVSACKPA